MKGRWNLAVFVVGSLALFSLWGFQSASKMSPGAEEAAVRAVNQAWFKAYAAGNAASLVSLYAEDAVVSAPGMQPARGRDAIQKMFAKDVADSRAAGLSFKPNPKTDVGVSGDQAYEWGTFAVTDKSGATVDKGKYLTVYKKEDGKWLIVHDTWNSDMPAQAGTSKAE